MIGPLPDIPELESCGLIELVLDRQVPLIVDCRLHVLVPQAENASREAREIWTGETRRRRCNNALRRCRTRQRMQKVLRLEFSTGGEFQTQYLLQPLPGTTASQGIIAPPPAGLACPNFSCFAGSIFRLWDKNVQPAIDDQWNLTVQHQLNQTTTLQVGYVGQWAYHLMVPFSYGQLVAQPSTSCATAPCTSPSPFFAANPALGTIIGDANVSGTQSNGTMKYNALQAVFQKTQSHGLQYQVAYTYAKCMSDNTGYYGTWSGQRASSTASPYWQNTYDRKAEWAPCYYDETHNLTAYAVYELPFGKGKQFGS